ncbi:MAG: hypothetical protein ACM3PC_08320 [Deltaproteobacteria bacterium]
MNTRTILLAAALAAACTTQNNSALVIIKVVPPKAETSTSTPTTPAVTTCTFDPASPELSFVPVNLAENEGNVAAVVQNFMPPTNSANTLNLDASVFLPHQAVVRYEFLGAAGTPAGVTVQNPAIIPVSGLEVASGQTATVGIPMFATGVISGAVPAGTFIRATFHIEGKLLGGANVHTSEREYLFETCDVAGCANNVCL